MLSPRLAACPRKVRKFSFCSYIAKTLTGPQLLFIFVKKPANGAGSLEIFRKVWDDYVL
jgi:hypothetical protein